ncbi:MAG: peptidoglycan-associated lipoprotein Pal [Nitrospiria bacterium]
MFKIQKGFLAAVLCLLVMGVAGCPKKPAETAKQSISSTQEAPPPVTPPPAEITPPPQPQVTEKAVEPVMPEVVGLKDVFFDFDKSTISAGMKEIVDANVIWLKANPQAKLKIEGHCDERGTNEYNLALGERRAHAVKQLLISEGIGASRISTISYGEDHPFCSDHNEACYQLNRRAHFVLSR